MSESKQIYSVAIYMVDRAYGGPEEGGWWYTFGEPDEEFAQFSRTFRSHDAASAYRARLERRVVDKLNVGRRSIGSVLSTGRYDALVAEGFPAAFPAERPFYE